METEKWFTNLYFKQPTPQSGLGAVSSYTTEMSDVYGMMVRKNDVLITTERDEFFLNEALVHVPALARGGPKRVLVVGGADGGALKELVRYSSVEEIVLCGVTKEDVQYCKKNLASIHQNAFDDNRVRVEYGEVQKFLDTYSDKFDLIIVNQLSDLVFPEESFFNSCKTLLEFRGVLVVALGQPFLLRHQFSTSLAFMKSRFTEVSMYKVNIPSLSGGDMFIAWGSNDISLRSVPAETLLQRQMQFGLSMKLWTPEYHDAMFAMPQYVRDLLKSGQRRCSCGSCSVLPPTNTAMGA